MPWLKRGLVYTPDGSMDWAVSHAYVPVPLVISDKVIRVYLAFWDKEKFGRLGYVDVDAQDPQRVIGVSPKPLLEDGRPGAFDDSGVTPSCAFRHNEKIYLFYIGWQKGDKVRYFLFSGIAVSEDGGESFKRLSEAPALDRCRDQIYVRSAPFVMRQNKDWHLWYIGGNDWIQAKGKQVPTYSIYHMVSSDPLTWSGQPELALSANSKVGECGLGRPWIIKDEDKYKMWYSIRSTEADYSGGYAESNDGKSWTRIDKGQILKPSTGGWDSEMICFNAVVDVQGRRYMFYNGNNFGETGFGVAELQNN